MSNWRKNFGSFIASYMRLCVFTIVSPNVWQTFVAHKNIFYKHLSIVSSDVELNPGPSKTCLKCEKSVPNRTIAYL